MTVDRVDETEYDANTDDNVNDGKYLTESCLRSKISVPYGCQGDHAEIQTIKPVPPFRVMVNQRT